MRQLTFGRRLRLSAVRFRIIRMALGDFAESMAVLDRLEGWAKRLQSAELVDAMISIRHEVISQRVLSTD